MTIVVVQASAAQVPVKNRHHRSCIGFDQKGASLRVAVIAFVRCDAGQSRSGRAAERKPCCFHSQLRECRNKLRHSAVPTIFATAVTPAMIDSAVKSYTRHGMPEFVTVMWHSAASASSRARGGVGRTFKTTPRPWRDLVGGGPRKFRNGAVALSIDLSGY